MICTMYIWTDEPTPPALRLSALVLRQKYTVCEILITQIAVLSIILGETCHSYEKKTSKYSFDDSIRATLKMCLVKSRFVCLCAHEQE